MNTQGKGGGGGYIKRLERAARKILVFKVYGLFLTLVCVYHNVHDEKSF